MENLIPKIPINIREYSSPQEKNSAFRRSSNYENNCIYDFKTFDKWFKYWTTINKKNKYKVYFRGMSEAKYKLYNSAQRTWLNYEMQDWLRPPNNQLQYKDFVLKMIKDALPINSILGNVFKLYGINGSHREFPCLSLLQHYGAPTPLLDWTYNLNVALFFATENAYLPSNKIDNELDDYFSIYVNGEQTQEIADIELRESVRSCFPDSPVPYHFNLLKLTDINTDPEFKSDDPFKKVLMATIYNQNIIPQEGLFIFNPYAEHPMEDLFKMKSDVEFSENGSHQSGFIGYNIHKRLGEYVKRKIGMPKIGITKDYIYPNLSDYSKRVKERVLNGLIS